MTPTPLALSDITPARARSFHAKVAMSDGCHRWTGAKTANGYGAFNVGRRQFRAHRVAWVLAGNVLSDALDIDHLCRVRDCVRADHLEAVSHRENMLRGETIVAANARKTACVNGHEFTPENTYRQAGINGRGCLTCIREASRRANVRRTAARRAAAHRLSLA